MLGLVVSYMDADVSFRRLRRRTSTSSLGFFIGVASVLSTHGVALLVVGWDIRIPFFTYHSNKL